MEEENTAPAYPYSRSKAESRKIMFKLVPDCIVTELPEGCKIGKVIRDDTIHWRSFRSVDSEGNRKTGSDLIEHMLRDVKFWFDRGASTFVIRFDKYNFVPPTKAEEQAKRVKSSVEPLLWDGRSQLIGWDRPLPDWDALYKNAAARNAARREALKLIIKNYAPPSGKRLIIDGASNKRNELPIVIRTTMTGEQCKPCYCKRLKNSIGETDYAMVFFARKLSEPLTQEQLQKQLDEEEDEDFIELYDMLIWHGRPTDDILLISNDTDCVLAAAFLQNLRRGEDREFVTNWFINLGGSERDGTGHTAKPRHLRVSEEEKNTVYIRQYFDANTFCRQLSKLLTASNIQFPVESFIAALYIGGGDYTDGYYGASYRCLAEAYIHYREHIGDLIAISSDDIGYGITVRGEAYASLLKFAFYRAYEKASLLRADCDEEPAKKKPSPNFIFEDHETIETVSFAHIKTQINKRIKVNNVKGRLPKNSQMVNKLRRWAWYIIYVYSSHKLQSHQLPDGKDFGWKAVQHEEKVIYVRK